MPPPLLQQSLTIIGIAPETAQRWQTELRAPHRHYHSLEHVAHILQAYASIAGRDSAILAAAWLHDIQYDPQRSDNEQCSADIAREDLKGTNVDIPLVVDLILDTRYHQGGTPLRNLFNDLDLLILAAEPADYSRYAQAIRREYAFVPLAHYAASRSSLLRAFDTQQIFKTGHFRACEVAAHRNLQWEITQLEQNPASLEIPLA